MEFRIAASFTDSLARLTGDEQKAVKTTAFDLQLNPANPGMSFHKLDRAKDKNFWSVRVSSDIRLIVHKSEHSLLLCYVDHHDKAYAWAERRKLETHPKTGAAQIVEIRETTREIVLPVYVQPDNLVLPKPAAARLPLFAEKGDDELLGYGVPPEWIPDVKKATEDSLLAITDHLPAEAAEALLELATGGRPRVSPPVATQADPFDHPDAQRRFRVMSNVQDLERALEYPWERWTVFLHPEQRQLVEREYSGPARVSGSAGTGKTVVALHRAVHLARRHPDARILLTTFTDTLASALHTKLKRLIGNEPRLGERIDVHSLGAIGRRLYKSHVGPATFAGRAVIQEIIATASKAIESHKWGHHFLVTEWEQVVDAWQLSSWESYRDVVRLGRRTRLPEAKRRVLWSIFEQVRATLRDRKLITQPELFTQLAAAVAKATNPLFDYVVVDESQDISVSHLRFLAALGRVKADALFFTGDLGQRIFQQPFSWKSQGVDLQGRARTLRVNYRTSHQIRTHADRLLGPAVADVDGNEEKRNDTVSVFNGPRPTITSHADASGEAKAVAEWIAERIKAGVQAHEIGVFVRSDAQLERAKAAVQQSKTPHKMLDDQVETASGHVSVGTMHLAKGLEFRAVVVMACDDEVIPLQERIETVGDDADLKEVYDTERHLLYVACTRARDHLLVTSVEPASEFLADMKLT